jgi:hypothetical protein
VPVAITRIVPLAPDGFTLNSLHGVWTTTTGDWRFRISNDERGDPKHPDHANCDWHNITAAVGLTPPAGAASSDFVWNANFAGEWLECYFNPTAASDELRLYIVGYRR